MTHRHKKVRSAVGRGGGDSPDSASPSRTPSPTRMRSGSVAHDHKLTKESHTHASPDGELDELRTRISDLLEERRHQDQILSSLAEQNWEYLVERSRRIKDNFNRDIDTLISDVQALCDHSARQKQLSHINFRPTRSRTHSSEEDRNSASTVAPSSLEHHGHGSHAPGGVHANFEKRKEFSWRDSQLTTMFRTSSDIRTIHSMFAAVLILFAIKVFINDTLSDDAEISLSILTWSFGKITYVIPVWFSMFLVHGMLLPIMWAWRRQHIGDITYSILYLLHQIVFTYGYARVILYLDLPIASSMILLCEQVRMVMKAHSFWRETLRIKHAPLETPRGVSTHLSNSEVNSTLLNTFSEQLNQFVLFHFVPTLIYRNTYPRTRYIRWKFVATCALECCGCILYMYIIFAGFCVPEFHSTAYNPGDFKALFVSLFNSVLPGIAVYLLTFFGLLHCWMNMFAEMTRFADRLFYQDWWASTSFSSYYRKWNMIVHDSLYNYIYVDLKKLGVPPGVCFFLTFMLSAIVHEYIIAVAMQFFYPVLLVMFLFFGVAFVYLTRFVGTSGRAWNIFFWTNLIVGNGILLIMYSREYYARQPPLPDSPPMYQFDTKSWLPYSWQPFVHY